MTPSATPEVDRVLRIVLEARAKKDYALFSSVCSSQFLTAVTNERFEEVNQRMSKFFTAGYHVAYMGAVNRLGHPVHFWRLWMDGSDTDLLIRMVLNEEGRVSGLLYSDPFDSAAGARK